jgi:peroxiredoxin
MKQTALLLSLLSFGATLVLGEVNIGKPAPEFTARDIEGKTHKLADYKGKIVVLESYNLDCPYCAHHFKTGAMQALQAEVTGKGAVWLVVNSSNPKSLSHRKPAAARKEWTAQKMKATAWIDDSDGKVGKAYGLKTTPHMVVIDKEGNVAYTGAIDDKPDSDGDLRKARNYVRDAVTALIAGKPVEVTRTKPYGCGIKY